MTADVRNITQREDRPCISRDDSDTRPTPAGGVSNVSELRENTGVEGMMHSLSRLGWKTRSCYPLCPRPQSAFNGAEPSCPTHRDTGKHAFNNTRNSRSEKIAEQFNESGMRVISKQSGS